MEQIMGLVKSEYVDSVDLADLEERAVSELLQSFDPHSVYIPAKYVDIANQDLEGGFEGIGIEFFVYSDTPTVVRILPGGPAEKAGIYPGDRILKIDTSSLLGLESNQIVKLIKGRKNSKAVATLLRKSSGEVFTPEFERDRIVTTSVFSGHVDEQTAYVKIEHFADKTHTDFVQAIESLNKESGINRLVLDLRDNPGGYLHAAVRLLDEMIDGTDVLAYTEAVNRARKDYKATPGGLCKDMDIAILVNQRSASASEIVSGALQDLDRGVVLGERTFGKGLVQETFELNDGSQIRLTIARYYIPSGRSIQKPYDKEGYHEFMTKSDSASHKNYETKSGRRVSSGGGVTPDILYSGSDSISYQLVNTIATDILDQHASNWMELDYKTWKSSKEVHTAIEGALIDYEHAKQAVMSRLVFQIFGTEAWYQFNIDADQLIQRALDSFQNQSALLNP